MQQHLDMGTHYYPPDVHADNRTHRYRSFMIEEILTEHTASAPAGELLKFGVQALLSARPFHSQLGKSSERPVCTLVVNVVVNDNNIYNIHVVLQWMLEILTGK